MSLDWFDVEFERRACLAREHSKDKGILCDNLFTSDELYFSLRDKSDGAFDACKFEAQRKGAIIVEMIDKEFWDKIGTMRICDACQKVTMDQPKMMICASCKGRYYCSKECQKKHWKAGHKKLCTAEFAAAIQSKTVRLCQRIMALLSMDARPDTPPVLNSWTGRFNQHLLKFGVRGAIYVSVCDSVNLAFIPMPLDVMDILLPVTPDCKFSYSNATEMSPDNPTVMLLVPTKYPTPEQNAGVLENTAVHAFYRSLCPQRRLAGLLKKPSYE